MWKCSSVLTYFELVEGGQTRQERKKLKQYTCSLSPPRCAGVQSLRCY